MKIMKLFKMTALLLTVIILCSGLTACDEDYKDAFIYIDFDSVPGTLDPQLADSAEELTVVRSIFDTLLRYDEKGNIVPSGAESFETDGNAYIFKLRKDAAWTDGTPVTADDYVFAFRRAVDPQTNAPFAASLFSVSGAKEINGGKAEPSTLGVTATDEYTLKIELVRDDPEFEKVLTTAITMPCNEAYFTNCKGKYGLTLDTTPSNGSYYVRKWTTDTKFLIRLAKNLDYTGPFEANSMRIYFTCGDDEPFTMLENDNTDLIYISTEEFGSVKEGGFNTVQIENTCYTLFISEKIDSDIRKALLQSVNSATFTEGLAETQTAADSIYPKVLSDSVDVGVTEFIKYDPDAAATLYGNKVLIGSGIEGVTVKYPSDSTSREVAKSIAAHWQQKLSCFINIEEASISSIAASYYGNYYDIIILPFSAPTETVTAYNAKLGYDTFEDVSKGLYEEYLCYPLFYSSTNIASGYKIQNLASSAMGGIIDASMLIKQQ